MYFLAKGWNFKTPAAIIAGITFMFSGFTISVVNLVTTLTSMIWTPLVILFFGKALEKDSKYAIPTGLFLAVMFLGGEPSIFYFTALFLLIYTACHRLGKGVSFNNITRDLRVYSSAVIIAVGLSSFQLIPFLELAARSDRPHVLPKFISSVYLPLRDVVNFFIPFFFGINFAKSDVGSTVQLWAPMIYIGAFTLFFIIMALVFKKEWRIRLLGLTAAFFLLLSFGAHTPVYRLAFKFLPGVSLVRYPVRFLFMVNFCFALLAGAGYDAYLNQLSAKRIGFARFFKWLLFFLLALSVIFLVFTFFNNQILSAAKGLLASRSDKNIAARLEVVEVDLNNARRFLGFFITGAILLYLAAKTNISRVFINAAVISLLAADLVGIEYVSQLSSSVKAFHRPAPNVEFLTRDKSLFRFYASPETVESNSYLNRSKSYEDALAEAKDKLCDNEMMNYGLYNADGYESLALMDYRKFMRIIETAGSPANTRLLDLANVKYVATMREIDAKGYTLAHKGAACIYENKNVMPRAFLVSRYIALKDEKAIANKLKSMEFRPQEEVVLGEEPHIREKPEASNQKPEKVEIVKYSPMEVVIEVAANSPKFLVLSDQYYPGWKASLDGKKVKIYKADFVFRAVHIDSAGSHTIRFIYDPFSFKAGLAISAATILLLILWLAYKRRR